MMQEPRAPAAEISLVVPTRGRPDQLARLIDSLAATAADPARLEVVLVVDEDDPESVSFSHEALPPRRVVVPPGLAMGGLNMAGYEACTGRYVMLLNDDVIARTPGWDELVLACLAGFPDGVALIHVNDGMFGEALSTFPLVSRVYCELAGGVCPRDYQRYRIDDHIGDVFNLLGLLGERRIVYLPDVVFEHFHFQEAAQGGREYDFNPRIMAVDAPRFEALRPQRVELALRLMEHIEERSRSARREVHRQRLESAADAFALRVPGRLRVRTQEADHAGSPVAVAVIGGAGDGAARRYHDDLRQWTPAAELLVVAPRPDESPGRTRNRLLGMNESDYIVLTGDRCLIEPDALGPLLSSLQGGAALAAPLVRDPLGRPLFTGVPLTLHGDAKSSRREMLAVEGDALAIDAARCRDLLFDERYQRYFCGLDYCLRAVERGLAVVCAQDAAATRLALGFASKKPTATAPTALAQFEQDLHLFADHWLDGERCNAVDHLGRIAELGAVLARSLRPGWGPGRRRRRARAACWFEEARFYPVLTEAAAELAAEALAGQEPNVNDPQTGHVAWLLGLCGEPVVLDADYRGFRLVLCGRFLAAPADEGGFDVGRWRRGDYGRTFVAESLDGLRDAIRAAPQRRSIKTAV